MQTSPRNIVLFSDGTGNSAAKLLRTNVWRTYQAVDLADPIDPARPRQFAFYDEGVGTSPLRPMALIGGAIGLGLGRNVRDLYAFLCRTYRPGDRIYAFGFSRGAFTIRVLCGLVLNQGIVAYDGNEEALERNVAAAYRRYRRLRYTQTQGLVPAIRAVRDWVIDGWHQFLHGKTYDDVPKLGAPGDGQRPWMKEGEARSPEDVPIEIEFVGLWDTVDAYGLPIDELTRAIDWAFWPLSMPDQKLNPRVKRAMHALALDDERNTFHPRLWHEDEEDMVPVDPHPGADRLPFPIRTFPYSQPQEGGVQSGSDAAPGDPLAGRHAPVSENENPVPLARPRISQVWFSGMHANVGGGYPDDVLSYVPLMWILRGARDAGLRLIPTVVAAYGALADENGPIYDSRKGLAAYYRYNPRRIAAIVAKSKIWLQNVNVHVSVFRRIATGLDGYAPIVIPTTLTYPDKTAPTSKLQIVMKDETVEAAATQFAASAAAFNQLDARTESVWNTVWRRRVAYFWTLFATLVLAAFPIILSVNPDGACRSRFCFAAQPIAALGEVLPNVASTWIDVFASNPGWFLLAVLAIALGYWRGGVLAQRITDRMRPAWYAIDELRPWKLPEPPGQPEADKLDRAIQQVRLNAGYKAFYRGVTVYALPFVFILLLLYAAVALTNQVGLAVAESVGITCPSDDKPGSASFETSEFCGATGIELQRDLTYVITVAGADAWRDGTIAAGPNGIDPNKVSLPMTLGVPLRRHLAQPWYKLILRVGKTGTDTYAPTWRKVAATANSPESYQATIKARSSGKLFAYVNDAVLFPVSKSCFYANNFGSGTISAVPASVAAMP